MCRTVVFCINDEHDTPDVSRGAQAAARGRGEELAAETFRSN